MGQVRVGERVDHAVEGGVPGAGGFVAAVGAAPQVREAEAEDQRRRRRPASTMRVVGAERARRILPSTGTAMRTRWRWAPSTDRRHGSGPALASPLVVKTGPFSVCSISATRCTVMVPVVGAAKTMTSPTATSSTATGSTTIAEPLWIAGSMEPVGTVWTESQPVNVPTESTSTPMTATARARPVTHRTAVAMGERRVPSVGLLGSSGRGHRGQLRSASGDAGSLVGAGALGAGEGVVDHRGLGLERVAGGARQGQGHAQVVGGGGRQVRGWSAPGWSRSPGCWPAPTRWCRCRCRCTGSPTRSRPPSTCRWSSGDR